jgi:hypothetical protein
MSHQHVLNGERLILEQKILVARREMLGLPTEEARRFLRIMEDIQDQFRWHLNEMSEDVRPP